MQSKIRRASARLSALVSTHLPARRILIESETGQRSISIGTREQLMGLASAAMIAGWLTVSTVQGAATEKVEDKRTEAELARMAAQVQALKADTAALKGTVATTAERIEARQQFLDALLTGKARGANLADLLPRSARRVSADEPTAAGVLAPFAALEQKQLALVNKAAATAETRLRDAEALIGRLGLDPSRFVAQSGIIPASGRLGMGGPFVPAGQNGQAAGADPRFAELFVNWQRVEQLEAAMRSLPAFVPVRNYTLTSNFGFRYDPFNGGSASHTGLDMAGPHGEPIYAAAQGRVVRAERFAGYGNCIDIDHGHGIITRYAHLSSIDVEVGDRVSMGQKIGGMGSTGRSTGTHLHYEVRIDGRPVNPRPFVDSSNYILAFKQDSFGPELASAQ
jgi:murein DD-endopeptidase MepM/ murein hydrolase activator NlpD